MSRYEKGSKIGLLLKDCNQEILKNHKNELSAKALRRLAMSKELDDVFNEK